MNKTDDPGKPLILVIDDTPEIRQVLRPFLEEAGYEVAVAADGYEALASARRRMPDLAICDVYMPSMKGWDVCVKLKEMSLADPMPVIMLTAKVEKMDEMRSYESSADEYFSKPPDFDALMAAVARLLAAKAAK